MVKAIWGLLHYAQNCGLVEYAAENTESILEQEVGNVFEQVLEDTGVYKDETAFLRFVESVNREG